MTSLIQTTNSFFSSSTTKWCVCVICFAFSGVGHLELLHAQITESNVLVLYNDDQGVSGPGFQIADYYRQLRPGVHIAPISGVNAILAGTTNEDISAQDYLDVIRPQVLDAIGAIPDSIDVIVTTKGLPLRINAGGNSDPNWKPFSSLESELTRIDSIDSVDQMGDQFIFTGFPQFDTTLASNPYYFSNSPFIRQGSDPQNEDIRLSTRLDGYSVGAVKNMLDRSQKAFIVPFGHHIVLDDTSSPSIDQITNSAGPGDGLFEVITELYPNDGMTNPVPVLFDNSNSPVVTSNRPVLGYVSHGTNDGAGGLAPGYILDQLDFQLSDGAVFLTHESFNAFSFDPAYSQAQGLIAQWLEVGGTAGLGHVQEPFNGPDNVTNEDIFYQMFLPAGGANAAPGQSGLTFVEAAWNATRQLSHVNTVIGDPLLRLQAWLPGDTNLDGVVEFTDFFTLDGNWLQPGSFEDGDFNGDGFVDENDLNILQANWLMFAGGALPSFVADISVYPTLDAASGNPVLDATLLHETNFNGDLNVDHADAEILGNSFGLDNGGDATGDNNTDGADFLLWQQQFFVYSLTADFDIDGKTEHEDQSIWQDSFGINRGGDSDRDDDTDGADFLAWQREFAGLSNTAGTSSLTSPLAAPEPSSAVLLAMVLLLLSGVRGRW